MSNHKIETQWMGHMQFNSLVNGHTIIMDAPAKVGGNDHGPIPKPFILTALSGCTGMDIIAILKKAHIQVQELNINVSGELSRQQPIEYTAIHIVFEIKGEPSCKAAVIEAVKASQEQHCGVSHMLKKILPVTWEIFYNGSTEFDNSIKGAMALEN